MHQPILGMSVWLSLSNETRNTLRALFHIPRGGYVEVQDGHVLCDGTMLEDLQELTVEKMQAYLDEKKDKDFYSLFNKVVDRIEGREVVVEKKLEPVVEETAEEPIKNAKPKRSNAKKPAKKK